MQELMGRACPIGFIPEAPMVYSYCSPISQLAETNHSLDCLLPSQAPGIQTVTS